MKVNKPFYILLGFLGVGLGAVGAILPLIPSFPFLLIAAFCFSRSSEKLETWFKSTNLYKNNLDSYIKGNGMTIKTKIRIMLLVTVLMSIGFIMMEAIVIGRIVLIIVWLFHILYFSFGVKTIDSETKG